MDNDNLTGPKKLLRNDQASDRVGDPSSCISNDMRIPFL